MTNESDSILAERNSFRNQKFGAVLHSDLTMNSDVDSTNTTATASAASSPPYYDSAPVSCNNSDETTPHNRSPWNNQASPYTKSPWNITSPASNGINIPVNGLMGSLVREEGHIYSLAASGDLLYTGSDSKNIRVWKNLKEFSGFKSNSGFVKAIVIHGERIFTGHQDGKIRIWKASVKAPNVHKRIGSLPTFRDFIKNAINPKNYIEIRKGRNVLRIKHYDAVSCLTLNEEEGLLYSGSWDKTLKVWRISDLKCLESIPAHDDAINSVVAGFDGFVFTGAADGTVKVWKRETEGRDPDCRHFLVEILLKQENAVTALAVERSLAVVYCGASDGLVNFWEREKQLSHGGVLRGHKMAVLCLAAAGNLVFSGSADKTICVWRKDDGGVHTCLSVFTGHTGPVKCLAVEEDLDGGHDEGKEDQRWIVYSGSLDKSVKVWRVSEHAPNLFSMKIAGQ